VNIELTAEQRKQVIKKRYNQKTTGYQKINKIIKLITKNFQWPGIKKNIIKYI
jgi:hypothetical protein